MRLQALVPLLPAGLVETLEQCGFRTDTDLLFSGTAMDIFRRLPSDTLTFQELKRCIALVAEKASAPAVRGDAWLAMEIPNRHEMLSGVTELDKLLGGFGDSRVIEISGEKGSGKTALALQVVLRHLACHPLSAAAWVDTTGEFSAERSAHMLNSSDGQAISTALERLQVSLAFDIEATHDVLEALLSSLSSNSSSQPVIRCVVIDTITPLLGPSLSNISSQGHAIMTTFMRQLRAIAQSHLLTFLVINNTTASTPSNPHSAFSTTAKKPALGPSFTFLTDATLWLSKYATEGLDPETDREDSATMHVAEVFRSKYTVSHTAATGTMGLSRCSLEVKDLVYIQNTKRDSRRGLNACICLVHGLKWKSFNPMGYTLSDPFLKVSRRSARESACSEEYLARPSCFEGT